MYALCSTTLRLHDSLRSLAIIRGRKHWGYQQRSKAGRYYHCPRPACRLPRRVSDTRSWPGGGAADGRHRACVHTRTYSSFSLFVLCANSTCTKIVLELNFTVLYMYLAGACRWLVLPILSQRACRDNTVRAGQWEKEGGRPGLRMRQQTPPAIDRSTTGRTHHYIIVPERQEDAPGWRAGVWSGVRRGKLRRVENAQ